MEKGGFILEKDRFEDFYGLLGSATKSIYKLKSKGMLPFGLTSSHTICMRKLYEKKDGLTRIQLAKLCAVDKAQISRIIETLTEKGYATEKRSTQANYRSKIMLTEEGVRVTEEINDLVIKINEYVSGDIPESDIITFYTTFNKICDNLKSAEELI